MHEIKTVDERLSGIDFSGNRVEVSTEEFSALNDEVSELRAAYEALQKELTHWKANHADLKERLHVATHRTDLPSDRLPLFDKMKSEIAALQKENESQAKRIAELELMNSEVK